MSPFSSDRPRASTVLLTVLRQAAMLLAMTFQCRDTFLQLDVREWAKSPT